ncbi:MAG: signal peptide peptidase SppA [Deltaproteobacteria bacterium]|nr:signal peptide peptidase SppA [Deltaproteobacteria bacterium]
MKKKFFLTGFILLFSIGIASLMGAWLFRGENIYFSRSITGGSKIGVIEVDGVITQSRNLIKTLHSYKNDPHIKAIVIRIDSPGGGVAPSQEIYEELIKAREQKVLIASMGSVAASGGYYIACAAHKIFANPGTITGSIGVIIEFANIEELLGKIGLKSVVVKSGKYKDILSPTRELGNDERAIIQSVIDSIQGQFIDAVALGRDIPRAKIAEIADGRIFSGEQAKTLGLVDELGNLEDAIKSAAEKTGISGEPDVVYPEKKRLSILDYVIEESASKISEVLTRTTMSAQFIMQANQKH